jgi:Na+-transporting NADH:ubiquinone oxidoreductase subunit F
MEGISLVALGVVMFMLIVLALVAIILFAKSKLVASGNIEININDDADKSLTVPIGGKLLNALAEKEIYLPSACGGGGTCGECKCVVLEGGGDVLPTETSQLSRKQVKEFMRLSCQVPVKSNMKIEVPAEVFDIKKWECTVRSNHNVATFIKELLLELPEGENVDFRAGGYIQIEAPAHSLSYKDFDVEEEYRGDWDKFNVCNNPPRAEISEWKRTPRT